MSSFRYRAMNAAGQTMRGELSAVSEADLFFRLKQNGLELLDAKPVRPSALLKKFQKKVSVRDLVELCVHLEQLEKVGVPILDSLNDIREGSGSAKLRDVLSEVSRDVSSGKQLSQAFAAHPHVFGNVFVGLIAAGEATGNMTDSFAHLVKHLKWNDELSRKVKKATRYPIFMLLMTFGMLMALMTVLVPQLSSFLKSLGSEMPGITRTLIAVSEALQTYWYLVLVIPIGLFVGIKTLYNTNESFAMFFDKTMYRVPVLGVTLRKIALSRFAHFFAVMFQSGISVLNCLDTARQVVANRCMAASLGLVKDQVESGSSLTAALNSSGEFPPLVVRMVKIGEETGNLKETLDNIAYFYDRDVNEAVDGLVAAVQPALTMIIGLIFAWVIAAVFGPVYNTFSDLPI